MNFLRPTLLLLALASSGQAANPAYSKSPAGVDVSKEIPKSFPIEPKDAAATWVMRPGFKIQLAAHEPQLRDPIAICFDENGRMFAVEMIDHPESRETKPHLGRVSMLEDKDGDGRYETSRIFADDLPWPTGLIWANGGLYVLATPDIWHFQDKDGDGRAEVREKVFTGFGPGDNADALMNHPVWGLDNRIHLATGLRASGAVRCLKRPDLPAMELNGRDVWFDPRTHEFGLETTGAQYGISFDDYGRKFGSLNSEHLRYWIYEERYAQRNPTFTMPQPVQGIAVDGGAPEVFRISPDEPWRIVRNRWRVGGLSPGIIEGGGRVSGFLVAASGLTVYRGDAYGADFVGNVFVGDVGSQLVHRKVLSVDGASLVGKRAPDEAASEFAASRDTWMRPVSFANAPDGCLHVVDMYREVCEISWAIPDEIKKHIDIRGGTDRGRIWRIVPDQPSWQRRGSVSLSSASNAELVTLLGHRNGWHRDTAARLLYERQAKDAVPLLTKLLAESKVSLARLHALGALDGLQALDAGLIEAALADADAHVRERGVLLTEKWAATRASTRLMEKLATLADDPDERVRFQVAFTLGTLLQADSAEHAPLLAPAFVGLAKRDHAHAWIAPAVLSAAPAVTERHLFEAFTGDARMRAAAAPFIASLIQIRAGSDPKQGAAACIDFISAHPPSLVWLRALGAGLRHAGSTIEQADTTGKLNVIFDRAAGVAANAKTPDAERLEAIELLGLASLEHARAPLTACLAAGQSDAAQALAITALAQHDDPQVTKTLLKGWPHYQPKAREALLTACIARVPRAKVLLAAIGAGDIAATDLSASQAQSLYRHKDRSVTTPARRVLAAVIPPSRAEVAAKFASAATLKGDAARGLLVYQQRCALCHRAAGQGVELGPDLVTAKAKGREGLLAAILNPNAEVLPQFLAYTLNTKDGETVSGFIARDEPESVTLRLPGGAEQKIPRTQIRGSSTTGQSVMPEGLEAGLDVQGMADLLTFIETLTAAGDPKPR